MYKKAGRAEFAGGAYIALSAMCATKQPSSALDQGALDIFHCAGESPRQNFAAGFGDVDIIRAGGGYIAGGAHPSRSEGRREAR